MIYTCKDFKGHYPVGVGAVVVAPDPTVAEAILRRVLADAGLDQGDRVLTIVPMPNNYGECRILCDGNY